MQYIIKHQGMQDYTSLWQAMQKFNLARDEKSLDEFWIAQHMPVFTLGLAGKVEHILSYDHNIPIIESDRGGQVTYHGPGQLIIYTLLDLRRLELSIRKLVIALEQSIIEYLVSLGIEANGNRQAPGVYVNGAKIASFGLRIKNGCSYHGISFNYAMDLKPFSYINVCGYTNLAVTQLSDIVDVLPTKDVVAGQIINNLARLIYTQ